MEPDLFAVKDQLIRGPIGHQKIGIQNNTPLHAAAHSSTSSSTSRSSSRPAAGPSPARPGAKEFEAGKVGILPGAYGFYPAIVKAGGSSRTSASRRCPARPASTRRSTAVTTSSSRRARRTRRARGSSSSGCCRSPSRCSTPALGYTPVRTDVLTPAYKAKNPYNAVALKALAHGSAPVTTDLRRGLQRAELAVVPDVQPGRLQGRHRRAP